jgi:hypothetical protein
MQALEFTAEIDANHRLQLKLPETAAPGPVRVLVLLPEAGETESVQTSNDSDALWMKSVAREWREELGDVREDIYTIEDGEPIHAAR